MRIRILPLPDALRPHSQQFDFPPGYHDYCVEQDFELWLRGSEHYSENGADWDYLPAYWNRWEFVNRNVREAQGIIDAAMQRPERTFTVGETDPLAHGVKLRGVVLFTGSRKADYGDRVFDIPILTHPHATPTPGPKRWLFSFRGNHTTHPLRQEMVAELGHHPDCIVDGTICELGDYVRLIQDSYIALAPRGFGMQSYRFYEAMQIGTVPLYLTDVDARPFRAFINWDSCSILRSGAAGLHAEFRDLDKRQLTLMGARAQDTYFRDLQYRRWCRYVPMTLETLM